jgi:hypothetical protein
MNERYQTLNSIETQGQSRKRRHGKVRFLGQQNKKFEFPNDWT